MEKLKKYNQKLLAIIGTLGLVTLIGLVIFGIVMFLMESSRRTNNREIRDNSLTLNDSNDNSQVDTKKSLQDITLEKPRLIDTLKTIYLLPVSQVNLANNKNGNYEESVLVSGGRKGLPYGKKSFHRYSGEYNNIIIYNQKEGTKDIVFNTKVFITKFSNRIVNSEHYLLITGVVEDSNKDKKLNENDLKSFFVYSIKEKKIRKFSVDSHDFVDYYFQFETDKILLRYAVDKNGNGEINHLQEPILIKELAFGDWVLSDFIAKDQMEKLQNMIN